MNSSRPLQQHLNTAPQRPYYKNFFPDDNPALDSVEQRNIRNQIAGNRTSHSQEEPIFASHEIDSVIKTLSNNKCPGLDGIDEKIIKQLHRIIPNFWTTLFNKCLLLGCFPKAWKVARVIPIPKADKTKLHSVAGYRGISLLSIPGKCLEKLLTQRLNYFLRSSGKIPQQQYGFTEGKSTADAIGEVTKFVRQSRQLGLKSCLVTLDISGAFDNAWHPGILHILQKMNCPTNIYHILRDFLKDRSASITIGSAHSSKEITKSCPQGSVLGPTLWNILISDLIETLSTLQEVQTIIYADDIVLMFRGPSHPHILTTLQDTLQKTDNWCKEMKLEISKDKSAVMPMYIRKRAIYQQLQLLRGISI